jgi:hypothetical protein
MDEAGIVKNIRRLSTCIDDSFLKSEDDKYFMFLSDFSAFHKQIELVYNKWFSKSKTCKDEDIIHQIFRTEIPSKDAKIWVKYSMSCLLKSSKRVYENIIQSKTNKEEQLFLCEMSLLREIAFEAAILMEIGFNVVEKKSLDFGHGKRFYIYSRETFDASRQILRKFSAQKTLGDFVLSPTSIFLIRQAIELWLQSIFGINIATDDKNKLVKLQPERLFDLLDSKGEKVNIPVSKTVIQKIHQWTQSYVHAGWIAYSWEIEHAQHVLQPIFYPQNVIIDKKHFDTIENQLRSILKFPKLKVHRLKHHDSTLK